MKAWLRSRRSARPNFPRTSRARTRCVAAARRHRKTAALRHIRVPQEIRARSLPARARGRKAWNGRAGVLAVEMPLGVRAGQASGVSSDSRAARERSPDRIRSMLAPRVSCDRAVRSPARLGSASTLRQPESSFGTAEFFPSRDRCQMTRVIAERGLPGRACDGGRVQALVHAGAVLLFPTNTQLVRTAFARTSGQAPTASGSMA